MAKRSNVVREVIQTEANYYDNLKVVKEAFIDALFNRKSPETSVLTRQECQVVFINWRDLYLNSNRLSKALIIRQRNAADQHDLNIGDILCEHLERLDCYIRFCSSQSTASVLLQKLIEVKPGFADKLKECQADPRSQGMPLAFYLLKPVKRITEYPILLEKLVKNTPVGHPDLFNVQRALELSRRLCDQVDEGMREKENSERLEWLQIHVDAAAAEPDMKDGWRKIRNFNSKTNFLGSRKFLLNGVMKKAKSGRELVGFLFNDFLLLTIASRPLNGTFSFDKHHDISLKPYRHPLFLHEVISVSASPEDSSMLCLETAAVSGSRSNSSCGDASSDGMQQRTSVSSLSSVQQLQPTSQLLQLAFTDGNECRMWTNKLKEAVDDAKAKHRSYNDTKSAADAQVQHECAGRVLLIILEATNLYSRPGTKIDPYLEATLASQIQTTPVAQATVCPRWNASMQFFPNNLNEDVICLSVFNKDYFAPDEFLGRTEIRLSTLFAETNTRKGPISMKLPLCETESGTVTIRIDVQHF